jgi:hypothetical protein
MKKKGILLVILAIPLAVGLAAKALPAAQPHIQLAILLDTSGSMDGLIDQARSRIWKIVNELAAARKNGRSARLQVALYEYGQSSIAASAGYLRRVVPLSDDLDRISEELFRLKTNGGDEYCGQVIQSAVRDLEWNRGSHDLKMIVIAGNEPFTQGAVDYRFSCREAISQGIIVNTIFCGDYQEGLRTDWKAGADLADGQYLAIDANQAPPPVSAPQDKEIARLNRELNTTYLGYGKDGTGGLARQKEQDLNAASLSPEVAVQRAAAKSASQYDNSSWDLVDAKKSGQIKLEEMTEAELPQEMKGMSVRERNEYVASKQNKRETLRNEIARLHDERERFVKDQLKNQASAGTLDEAILHALHLQAAAKNFKFGK